MLIDSSFGRWIIRKNVREGYLSRLKDRLSHTSLFLVFKARKYMSVMPGLENSRSWSHKDWEPQVVLVQLGLEGTWALGSFLGCCRTSHHMGNTYPLCWGFYYMPLNATSTETPTLSLHLVISRGCDSTPRATYLLIRESPSPGSDSGIRTQLKQNNWDKSRLLYQKDSFFFQSVDLELQWYKV